MTPKSTTSLKRFMIAPDTPYQSRHRTTVHNLKFGISFFFFARFSEWSMFLPFFPLPTRTAIFVGSKRIQTYRNVQLYIPSCLPLFLLSCIKSLFSLCIFSPLQLSSLFINYSRLPIIILFSYLLSRLVTDI